MTRARPAIPALGLAALLFAAMGLPLAATSQPATPRTVLENTTHSASLSAPFQRGAEHYPLRLSETGLFSDVRSLIPSKGLNPYTVRVPFYSDGATKRRWIALPREGNVGFDTSKPWTFPAGTLFVKHFEINSRRLETRVLVRDDTPTGVFGLTYRWREDGSDADLLPGGASETLQEGKQTFTYTYPSRTDCLSCHTPLAGGVLGVRASQLGPEQIREWSRNGLFGRSLSDEDFASVTPLTNDPSAPLGFRLRSYLDANCAHCHQPGGSAGNFDARLSNSNLLTQLQSAPVLINLGVGHARYLSPKDPWRSILLQRLTTLEQPKMPPLGHARIDSSAVDLVRAYLRSLPGTEVLQPPALSPPGGDFAKSPVVTLSHPDAEAEIHYTLDGSPPSENSPVYRVPLTLSESATVRARAYKPGWTRSVITQDTYIIAAAP